MIVYIKFYHLAIETITDGPHDYGYYKDPDRKLVKTVQYSYAGEPRPWEWEQTVIDRFVRKGYKFISRASGLARFVTMIFYKEISK